MATGAVLRYLHEVYSQPSLYDLWSSGNWSNSSQHENNSLGYGSTELISVQDGQSTLPMTAAHFGLATGLLAILLNSHLMSSKFLKTAVRASEYQQWAEALLVRVFFVTACLVFAATAAPFVAVIFFLLAFYRRFVHHVLSYTNPSYACLLEGTDAVWALEDDTSKSIINVLAFFEVEIIDNVFKPQLLGMLRKLMQERILSAPEACPKFWQYRRRSRLGYFYWERQQEVRVEDHVQYMTQEDDLVNLDAPDLSEDCFRQEYYGMSESVLKGLVSELANSPLPYDNAASWEILVGRDPILDDLLEVDPFEAMEEGKPEASGRYRRYPVLFRVHHSMGDGVALIKLLLGALADKKDVTETPLNITETQLLGFDNEETKRLNRRKSLSRLDSIDIIQCSTGSFDYINCNKAKRPNFLDLSPTTLENSKKKVNVEFLETSTVEDDSEGTVQMSVESAPNIIYKRSSRPVGSVVSPLLEWVGEDVFDEDDSPLTSDGADGACGVDVYHRDLHCYPVPEGGATLDDSIRSANEIILDHNEKTIYFDNKKDVDVEDQYEKVLEYYPPLSGVDIFRDKSPPRSRCKSPMPPYKRDASRIARVLDEIPKIKTAPFLRDNQSPPRCEARLPRVVGEILSSDSPFLTDNSPPKPKVSPANVDTQTARAASPYDSDGTTIIRNESPVPKIHRKKYPVLWNDLDNEPSPAIARNNFVFSRPSSPFMRYDSPGPYHNHSMSKFDSPLLRSNALRLQNDCSVSRSDSPLPRYNSSITYDNQTSRCNSPLTTNNTPHPYHNPIPRCHSPILRNDSALSDLSASMCNSPFMRNNKPLPRNDNPVPRCNSPFMRNNSPLPHNDIPRCNSPFMRIHSTVPNTDCPPSTSSSPFHKTNSSLHKKTPISGNKPLLLINSHIPTIGKNSSSCLESFSSVKESSFSTSFVGSVAHEKSIGTKAKSDQSKNSMTKDIVPTLVPIDRSSTYVERFIKGHFFCPDGEVYNRRSVSPNCFVKLLDSINHRPSKIEQICNYVKNMCALVFAPATLIHQTMVKAADVNPMHGPVLSGEKVVSWYCDSNEEICENLLSTIKRVKNRMSDARFTDVFLSALSASLESYFLQSGCDSKSIPETVSVVIPVRMITPEEIAVAMGQKDRKAGETISKNDFGKEDGVNKDTITFPTMENRFSVALLSLPLTSISMETKRVKPFSPIGRLREICKHTNLLRKSPDYQVNYWLMRVVSTYLPLPLLAPILNSTQSTMVVSNLLGPPTQLELGGYKLKDIIFWVPNRAFTGVGVSVLSYAGRIQIGIVADRALISCHQDANIIIEGIISEVKRLDEFTAPVLTHPLNA